MTSNKCYPVSASKRQRKEIHLLNVHRWWTKEKKRAKITSNQPDIQILPRKNHHENVEKDFFLIFISAMCSAVASLLLGICWMHTQDPKIFKNENFPVCLVVLKYFISPSSEIGYCQSVFAKKYFSRRRCANILKRPRNLSCLSY